MGFVASAEWQSGRQPQGASQETRRPWRETDFQVAAPILRVDPGGLLAIVPPLATGPSRACPCGGIGRRARLKIEFRKECWFDPGQGHHSLKRGNLIDVPANEAGLRLLSSPNAFYRHMQ